ncbi:MAG: dicarboxylate/amino acid:cation symporter, partial [Candidatus Scalindua sp.]
MKKFALHWQILTALICGTLYGLYLTEYVSYISWMGVIFMRALKMLIIPLIVTSITSGIANIGSGRLGRLGLKTISYYMITSVFAILAGLLMVNLLKPGVGADMGFVEHIKDLPTAKESFGSTLISIIPENIFVAFVKSKMLPIIFISILSGIFITKLSDKHKDFFITATNAGFELMMKITHLIIRFTPYGVFGIVALTVSRQASDTAALLNIANRLGLYMIAVMSGLSIHAIITLPLILTLAGKINPYTHFKALRIPLITAFSTSSSSATLPLTLEAVEEKSGVSNRVSSLVLPLGATINMDGTALYECVAAMFIAQAYGIELTFLQQTIVVATALLASIGAAGIPMAGFVMISIILTAIGLPLEGVGLILAVDRIL